MFEHTFSNIDDVLHKDAGCTSELDYTEQSSWLLFPKYLDALEQDKATEAMIAGRTYKYILDLSPTAGVRLGCTQETLMAASTTTRR